MGMTALDFEGIKQNQAKYCHTVDLGDFDGVASVFSPDGFFEIVGHPDHPATRRGTEALKRSPAVHGGKGHGRHTALGAVIEGDGQTARSVSSVVMTRDYGPPAGKGRYTHSTFGGGGIYVDDLVKHEGKWVIAHRRYYDNLQMGPLIGKPLDIAHVDAGANRPDMTPLDREAIGQLMTRFGHTLDFEDPEGFAQCFTEDGSYSELVDRAENHDDRLVVRGRAALKAHAESVNSLGYRALVRNYLMSSVIVGTGERAQVSSYAMLVSGWPSGLQPLQPLSAAIYTTGIFRDEVIKVDGRWLLSKRTFRRDTMPEVTGLVGKPLNTALFRD